MAVDGITGRKRGREPSVLCLRWAILLSIPTGLALTVTWGPWLWTSMLYMNTEPGSAPPEIQNMSMVMKELVRNVRKHGHHNFARSRWPPVATRRRQCGCICQSGSLFARMIQRLQVCGHNFQDIHEGATVWLMGESTIACQIRRFSCPVHFFFADKFPSVMGESSKTDWEDRENVCSFQS